MIKPIGFKYTSFKFPVGEIHIQITDITQKPVSISFNFEYCEEIIELLLICDALKRSSIKLYSLIIPYIPFSRQDRVCEAGEPFSLAVVANLINSCGAERVVVADPHSDVTTALINNCLVHTQDELFDKELKRKKNFFLVSPDGGALKKIYKIASKIKSLGVIECSKKRDTKTGVITGVHINSDHDFKGRDCVIVDDICDGGRTFIEIGRALKARGAKKVSLFVSHGFFTKGLDVFKGFIDEIYTAKGVVK